MINSFHEADKTIGQEQVKKLGPRGLELRRESKDMVAVNYRGTNIVTFYWNGNIQLNSGGWLTRSTLTRMNQHLPSDFAVEADKSGVWTIKHKPTGVWGFYGDGLVIDPSAKTMFTDTTQSDVISTLKSQELVIKYVDAYIEHIINGTLHEQQDVQALNLKDTEVTEGNIQWLPNKEARWVLYSGKYPPSLLRRAVYLDGPDPFYFEMMENVTTFPKALWHYQDERSLDFAQRCFRRVLLRLMRKSMKLPL